jgi:GNAT superfamily N-acetyltransferase
VSSAHEGQTGPAANAIHYEVDAVVEPELRQLWEVVWNGQPRRPLADVLARSLAHVGAYDETRLIGFVNVASDGGEHAFLLDTAVHPDYRRRGIGANLVRQAIELARARGALWLHVDFEAQYASFYGHCGFRPTEAGLIAL